MNKSKNLVCFFVLFIFSFIKINTVVAQTSRFEMALPGYQFSFPRDHGNHDNMLIEWWYFTGHLQTRSGKRFGYELTFFRRGIEEFDPTSETRERNPSLWVVKDIYLAHFAVTDISAQTFFSAEKISRSALGKAGSKDDKMHVWIDDWSATQSENGLTIKAETDDWSINLELQPQKDLIIHGMSGISKKGSQEGDASHYYSYTRLKTQGTLIANGQSEPVSGLSWMDHEFASNLLGDTQIGWDWFSIQLDDGSEIMLYQIREKSGNKDPISSGTLVSPDGTTRHLKSNDFSLKKSGFWLSERSGARYPLEWEITIPSAELVLHSKPLMQAQELITTKSTGVTYWEGASDFEGIKKGKRVSGSGYIELTGYVK